MVHPCLASRSSQNLQAVLQSSLWITCNARTQTTCTHTCWYSRAGASSSVRPHDLGSARPLTQRAFRILQRSSHIRSGDVRYCHTATQHARCCEQLPRGPHVSDGRIGSISSATCALYRSDRDFDLRWVHTRRWYSTRQLYIHRARGCEPDMDAGENGACMCGMLRASLT